MSGAAQPDRRGLEVIFERIADVIDRQQRCAMIEYAVVEQVCHRLGDTVAHCAGQESPGENRHAA